MKPLAITYIEHSLKLKQVLKSLQRLWYSVEETMQLSLLDKQRDTFTNTFMLALSAMNHGRDEGLYLSENRTRTEEGYQHFHTSTDSL